MGMDILHGKRAAHKLEGNELDFHVETKLTDRMVWLKDHFEHHIEIALADKPSLVFSGIQEQLANMVVYRFQNEGGLSCTASSGAGQVLYVASFTKDKGNQIPWDKLFLDETLIESFIRQLAIFTHNKSPLLEASKGFEAEKIMEYPIAFVIGWLSLVKPKI